MDRRRRTASGAGGEGRGPHGSIKKRIRDDSSPRTQQPQQQRQQGQEPQRQQQQQQHQQPGGSAPSAAEPIHATHQPTSLAAPTALNSEQLGSLPFGVYGSVPFAGTEPLLPLLYPILLQGDLFSNHPPHVLPFGRPPVPHAVLSYPMALPSPHSSLLPPHHRLPQLFASAVNDAALDLPLWLGHRRWEDRPHAGAPPRHGWEAAGAMLWSPPSPPPPPPLLPSAAAFALGEQQQPAALLSSALRRLGQPLPPQPPTGSDAAPKPSGSARTQHYHRGDVGGHVTSSERRGAGGFTAAGAAADPRGAASDPRGAASEAGAPWMPPPSTLLGASEGEPGETAPSAATAVAAEAPERRPQRGSESGGGRVSGAAKRRTTSEPEDGATATDTGPQTTPATDPSGPSAMAADIAGGRAVPMSSRADARNASRYQCLLREQIQFFEVDERALRAKAQGRNVPIQLGQVGIRCVHCAGRPDSSIDGTQEAMMIRGAVYYPAKVESLYQAVQNMANNHFSNSTCPGMPRSVLEEILEARRTRPKRSGGKGKRYFSQSAEALGIFNAPDGSSGLFMRSGDRAAATRGVEACPL